MSIQASWEFYMLLLLRFPIQSGPIVEGFGSLNKGFLRGQGFFMEQGQD